MLAFEFEGGYQLFSLYTLDLTSSSRLCSIHGYHHSLPIARNFLLYNQSIIFNMDIYQLLKLVDILD
jgi:hypothetical protein